ncbi:zona pellucida sperm-binding protein 3-like [Melanerpes formicivorus]|uniref:zona pellucida sperm-binding protein 3-like n=1 Tax=Melanerpes formicivorus TaxID=211600 RepID=UPI00358EBA18
MASAASESPGPAVVAPVVASAVGTRAAASALAATTVTGEAHAHPSWEEPTMNFTLRLLDEHPSTMKKPLVLSPSSAIRLEARASFSPSIPLRLSVEQCYGSSAAQLGRSRRVFTVVNSYGCLHGQKLVNLSAQHQPGMSTLRLTILAPVLEDGREEEEVYVHCLLMLSGPGSVQGHGARTCFYSQATASWHNAEDPSESAPCRCCDTSCPLEGALFGELPGLPGEGTLHQETVGPLLVQKEKVPWYEAPCRTVKRLLLAALALLGSALLAATLVGALLGLALATWRLRGQRRRRRRGHCPFQAELQSVVGALASRESEKGHEVGPGYHSLAQS